LGPARSGERRDPNYHHRLPLTQAFGTGTLSSSDGQRFPVKGKSITARRLSRYFARGQVISTYTHVSDQHSTHTTDTAGATLANFALFDLVGRQLSPRIRDLVKITLYRTGPRAEFADRSRGAGRPRLPAAAGGPPGRSRLGSCARGGRLHRPPPAGRRPGGAAGA
jgi:TnpA family transposase